VTKKFVQQRYLPSFMIGAGKVSPETGEYKPTTWELNRVAYLRSKNIQTSHERALSEQQQKLLSSNIARQRMVQYGAGRFGERTRAQPQPSIASTSFSRGFVESATRAGEPKTFERLSFKTQPRSTFEKLAMSQQATRDYSGAFGIGMAEQAKSKFGGVESFQTRKTTPQEFVTFNAQRQQAGRLTGMPQTAGTKWGAVESFLPAAKRAQLAQQRAVLEEQQRRIQPQPTYQPTQAYVQAPQPRQATGQVIPASQPVYPAYHGSNRGRKPKTPKPAGPDFVP
jgi:hypothetical protein